MANGKKNTIKTQNSEIEYTDEYIYLGQLMTQNDSTGKEIGRRIANGWRIYWGMSEIIKDKKLHVNIKNELYNTCILPVLTYNCQTNPKLNNKLTPLNLIL